MPNKMTFFFKDFLNKTFDNVYMYFDVAYKFKINRYCVYV